MEKAALEATKVLARMEARRLATNTVEPLISPAHTIVAAMAPMATPATRNQPRQGATILVEGMLNPPALLATLPQHSSQLPTIPTPLLLTTTLAIPLVAFSLSREQRQPPLTQPLLLITALLQLILLSKVLPIRAISRKGRMPPLRLDTTCRPLHLPRVL